MSKRNLIIFVTANLVSPNGTLAHQQLPLIAENNVFKNEERADLIKLENDYKAAAKAILADYSNSIQVADAKADQIGKAKSELLTLKVPTKFKDLHLNLVLAMVKMENFFASRDENEKIASQQMINQIKVNYAWLN